MYSGREQSQAKHAILGRYLTPFANKILHTWDTLDFIDGFSGPWQNRDKENLSDTSIGVALETLSAVAAQRGHSAASPKIRCIFNEANPKSYALLENFINRSRDRHPLLKIDTFEGKFENNAALIRSKANHQFRLLFVDPTGYTGFSPDILALFKDRSSEVIVNVMRSFLQRFAAGQHKDREAALIGLIGKKRATYLIETGLTIETLESEYLSMLRGTLGYKYAGNSPIHNPDKNEIHFNLAYGTHHPAGMEVMRDAEYKALEQHDRTRYKKSIDKKGGDLFGDLFGEMEIMGPYLTIRKNHREKASSTIRSLLKDQPEGLEFTILTATAQQNLFLKQAEIGDVLVEMTGDGIIRSDWKTGTRRKPKKGDIIKLCSPAQ